MRPQEIVHSTFEMSQKAVTTAESLALMPPKMAMTVFTYARHIVADTTELVFPTMTQKELACELAGEHLLEKASEAIIEIEIGKQANLPEIEFEGRAALAEKVIEAEAAELIPWEVTEEVIGLAVQAEVDPDFEPLLDNETQNKLRRVFRRHNIVQDMFRYKQNKL